MVRKALAQPPIFALLSDEFLRYDRASEQRNRSGVMNYRFIVLSAFCVLAMNVSATSQQPKPVFGEKVVPTQFPELIAMVRSEIEPGGRWEYVPKSQRRLLEEKFDEMERVLDGRQSVDELSNAEKLRLINAQEHANAILTQHDGRRLICERVTPTGSHRPKNVCITLAERKRANEESTKMLRGIQKGGAMPREGGGRGGNL
jgi:hypothetical protein